jgi:cytochrome c oxidase subunit 1
MMDHTIPIQQNTIPAGALNRDQKLLQWISSVDHKQIGIMYLLLSLIFLVIGGG